MYGIGVAEGSTPWFFRLGREAPTLIYVTCPRSQQDVETSRAKLDLGNLKQFSNTHPIADVCWLSEGQQAAAVQTAACSSRAASHQGSPQPRTSALQAPRDSGGEFSRHRQHHHSHIRHYHN
ncbi:hypothetical protein E2C01_034310 [Portunus trituberculatus]|uniref:Uncharacterized protein n=1 Tax=Portunus trituberculatus TaxID=210409 RepID=A0A5B7F584_PORTR|nr:hypothetical protein [Portunus trituberculatus]